MNSGREFDKQAVVRIVVKGNLDPKWSDWFDGLAIESQPNDKTSLTGLLPDQAALYGILLKLHNLGLTLLCVKRAQE